MTTSLNAIAAAYYTQPDPADTEAFEDVNCPPACDATTTCTICDATLCEEHSDEFAACVDPGSRLHHHDCARFCGACVNGWGEQ